MDGQIPVIHGQFPAAVFVPVKGGGVGKQLPLHLAFMLRRFVVRIADDDAKMPIGTIASSSPWPESSVQNSTVSAKD